MPDLLSNGTHFLLIAILQQPSKIRPTLVGKIYTPLAKNFIDQYNLLFYI